MTLDEVKILIKGTPDDTIKSHPIKKFPTKKEQDVQKLKDEINAHQAIYGQPPMAINGAYGEFCTKDESSLAYVKRIYKDLDGIKCELYGCAYKWKGIPDPKFIEKIGICKRVFMSTAKLFTKFPFNVVLAFTFPIFGKRIIKKLIIWGGTIFRSVIEFQRPIRTNYNKCVQEVLRAAEKLNDWDFKTQDELKHNTSRLIGLAGLVLEFDNAYRIRFQDMMECVSKDNLINDPLWEIKRLLSIYIERENCGKNKYQHLIKIFKFLLNFNPSFVELVKRFLLEIDLEKIKPDEDDFYFSLLRTTYNVRGFNQQERFDIKRDMDNLKGNVMLPMKC